MPQITFKYCTKKKAQYLGEVVKLYKKGRSIKSICRELPVGKGTVYNWIHAVFDDGRPRKKQDDEPMGKKANSTKAIVAAVAIATGSQPATAAVTAGASTQARLQESKEATPTNTDLEHAEPMPNGDELQDLADLGPLSEMDEKSLRELVKKLGKRLKTQTIRGDLYKKMLEIASEDTGIDFLKKLGAGQ